MPLSKILILDEIDYPGVLYMFQFCSLISTLLRLIGSVEKTQNIVINVKIEPYQEVLTSAPVSL